MTQEAPPISEMVAWLAAHEGHFAYSEESGRLDPDVSGYTDCSGLARYLYLKFAGLDIGTYTGDECTRGELITTSKTEARAATRMLPGDLIFYRWESRPIGSDPFDHVNIYIGGGKVQNHGGPGHGPVLQSLAAQNVDRAVAVMVRRYIQPPAPPSPSVVTPEETDMFIQFKDAPTKLGKESVFQVAGPSLIHVSKAAYAAFGKPKVDEISIVEPYWHLPIAPAGAFDPRK